MSDLSPFDLLFFGQHSHFLDNHLFDALDFYPDHSEGADQCSRGHTDPRQPSPRQ